MTRLRFNKETGAWDPIDRAGAVLHFKEFETAQLTEKQAAEIGAHFDPKDGVTTVRYERSLREHLARSKADGRDIRWREH
jgi:hypothetical protein